jgi:hypothetical protein
VRIDRRAILDQLESALIRSGRGAEAEAMLSVEQAGSQLDAPALQRLKASHIQSGSSGNRVSESQQAWAISSDNSYRTIEA